MAKPFTDIQTDAEYLRAVGLGYHELHMAKVHINDDNPANKWDNLADVLRVLGPQMDRRGWSLDWGGTDRPCLISIWEFAPARRIGGPVINLPHLALLEAFYNAHAQGETS